MFWSRSKLSVSRRGFGKENPTATAACAPMYAVLNMRREQLFAVKRALQSTNTLSKTVLPATNPYLRSISGDDRIQAKVSIRFLERCTRCGGARVSSVPGRPSATGTTRVRSTGGVCDTFTDASDDHEAATELGGPDAGFARRRNGKRGRRPEQEGAVVSTDPAHTLSPQLAAAAPRKSLVTLNPCRVFSRSLIHPREP